MNNANGRAISHVVQVSKTVYLSDGGTQYNAAQTPDLWAIKDASWILQYNTDGNVTGANLDWAAPSARHLEFSNVLFMDGHVKSLKPEAWYSGTRSAQCLNVTIGCP